MLSTAWPKKTFPTKETTLERAAFKAGWSELTWSGRAQPVLAWNHRDISWQKMERRKIINSTLSFFAVTNINSWRVKSALSNVVSLFPAKPGRKHVLSKETRPDKKEWKQESVETDGKWWPIKKRGWVLIDLFLFVQNLPDRTFHHFRVLESADRRKFWDARILRLFICGVLYREVELAFAFFCLVGKLAMHVSW